GQECVGILALLAAANEAVAEHVLFGEQLQFVVGEAGLERQDERHRLALRGQAERFLPAIGKLRIRTGLREDRRDAGPASGRIGGEQRLLPASADRAEVLGSGFINIAAPRALGCEIARGGEAEIDYPL